MKIAITGASGFIGTEVLKQFDRTADVEVIALTRTEIQNDTPGNAQEDICMQFQLATNQRNPVWVQTDYSVSSLQEIFQGIDAVIHLAAVRGTSGSISDYHINETLTENVLIAMGEAQVKHIVYASSIAVYSDTAQIPWKEDSIIEPKTLYGITKAACEYLCKYYSKKYGFTYSLVRIAQLLGLGERKKLMMNVFINLAYKQEQLRVIGKSIAKRQYIDVQDLAEILIKLATASHRECATINAGMEAAYGNLEIAELVNQIFENDTPIAYDNSIPESIESSQMDIQVLKKSLAYTPFDMKQSLKRIREEMLLDLKK